MNKKMSVCFRIHVSNNQQSFAFLLAKMLGDSLEQLDYQVRYEHVALPKKSLHCVNIVVGPHEFYSKIDGVDQSIKLAAARHAVHVTVVKPWEEVFVKSCRYAAQGSVTLDINQTSVDECRQKGMRCFLLPLGYHRLLDRVCSEDRDVDVITICRSSQRRQMLLAQSASQLTSCNHSILFNLPKVLEVDSAFYQANSVKMQLLSKAKAYLNLHYHQNDCRPDWVTLMLAIHNRAAILSEVMDAVPLVAGEHYVECDQQRGVVNYSELVARAQHDNVADRAYQFIKDNYDFTQQLSKLLPLVIGGNKHYTASDAIFFVRRKFRSFVRLARTGRAKAAQRLNNSPKMNDKVDALSSKVDFSRRKISLLERNARRMRQELSVARNDRASITQQSDYYDQVCPEVSVIITAYNYANFIKLAIDSVLESLGVVFEIIVVNDYSTDNTSQVLDKMVAKYNDSCAIKLIHHRWNQGLSAARNTGVASARSSYVFILDADNTVYPRCLLTLKNALDASDETVAFAYPIIERYGELVDLISFYPWSPALFADGNYIDAMAMIKKSHLLAVGGYSQEVDSELGGWEDYALWLSFASHTKQGILVSEILARYRRGEDSMSSSMTLGSRESRLTLLSKYNERICVEKMD